MFEKSLQSIQPDLCVPYWDYTIEGQLMADNDDDISYLTNSEVFEDDWFGELHPTGGIVSEGRWAYTPIANVDTDTYSVYSPYGLARSPWNANNVPYLTRFEDFYGHTFT